MSSQKSAFEIFKEELEKNGSSFKEIAGTPENDRGAYVDSLFPPAGAVATFAELDRRSKILTSWKAQDPVQGATPADDTKLDKILQMMIEDRQERKSIAFSSVTAGKIALALEGRIYRKPAEFKIDRDRTKSTINPFNWITGPSSPSETAQTPEVLKWFRHNITSVGDFKWRDVSQGVLMRVSIGDYVFKGKPDLQLSEGDEPDNAIMIVQLKKTILKQNGQLDTDCASQCQIETLATGRISMYPVVGVLTDTTHWVFYWMGSKNILNYHKVDDTTKGVSLVLSVIHNFVQVQKKQESGDDIPFDFPPRIPKLENLSLSQGHIDQNMDLLPDLDIYDQMAVFRDYYEKQLSYYV